MWVLQVINQGNISCLARMETIINDTWHQAKSNSGGVLQVINQGNINRLACTKQWGSRTGLKAIPVWVLQVNNQGNISCLA
ncbi:MAG: hypothetical protein N4A74_25475, partial [Carboxylicivirga sp.]|nr:hypothetical protein [Carboxylicivirga sp.]